MQIKTGLGQDSHRFDLDNPDKVLMLGGIAVPDHPALQGNSDADVLLHALCNAISGITGFNILGKISDELCLQQGIQDSQVYLEKALAHLNSWQITHVSFSVECKTPKITPLMPAIKAHIAELLNVTPADIGITATTGEGLTDFGRGAGIQVLCIVTAVKSST